MVLVMMIVLVFFAVVGLIHFIIAVVDSIVYRRDKTEYALVIPDPCAKDIEYRLRAAVSRMRGIYGGRIIAVCDADSGEARAILQYFQRDCPQVEVLTTEQYIKRIRGDSS